MREEIVNLYQKNYSQREVAEKLDIQKWEVRKVVEEENISRERSEACHYKNIHSPVPLHLTEEGYECWWDQTGQQDTSKYEICNFRHTL